MTVNVSKPLINIREQLKAPPVIKPWRERQLWFDSLLKNGTFDSDTVWTKGPGWTIAGGKASFNAAAGQTINYTMSGLKAGLTFRLGYTVLDYTAGTTYPQFGGSGSDQGEYKSAAGTYTQAITLTADRTSFAIGAFGNSNLSIDNVFLHPADASGNVIHRLPRGWKPLHVYENGLLMREGATHDYTVVFDGFDYIVKPSVAPGISTETCIVGIEA